MLTSYLAARPAPAPPKEAPKPASSPSPASESEETTEAIKLPLFEWPSPPKAELKKEAKQASPETPDSPLPIKPPVSILRKKRPDAVRQEEQEEDQLGPETWHLPLPKAVPFLTASESEPDTAESEHGDHETIEWFRPTQRRLASDSPPLLIRDGSATSRPSSPDQKDHETANTPKSRSSRNTLLQPNDDNLRSFSPAMASPPDDLPSDAYKVGLDSPTLRPLPSRQPILASRDSAWSITDPPEEDDDDSFLDKRASTWSVGDDLEEVMKELRGERFGFQHELSEKQVSFAQDRLMFIS